MITRRTFVGGAAASAPARARDRKPNFLFLLGDDHAAYVMGCDGNRLASTPSLDRLAAEGTRFSAAYCNSPVCTPSRQSFLTGLMPSAAGVTVLKTALDPEKPNLARQLRAAGFRTGVVGKMHFNRPSQPGLHGFDSLMTEQEVARGWTQEIKPKPLAADLKIKPRWQPFKDHARIWLNSEKLPVGRTYEEMRGTYIARQGVKFLREHKEERFALWVSLQEPHSPFDFPIEYRDRFDPARFTVPRVGPEDAWQIPLIFRDLSDAEKRGIAAAYYTSTAFLDHNIGVVLDELRRLDLENDTYVVYLGDNGYSLGQHGRFEKHCGYEPALRVPLIMRWPGRVRKGVATGFAEFIDVAPTVLDMLGVDPLPGPHGVSLRPYLEGARPKAPRTHIVSQYLENEEAFVRTADRKLIFGSGKRRRTDGYETDNPTPGRYLRLFDLKKDPDEFTDISKREPDTVKRLEQLILDRYAKTHPDAAQLPKGLTPEEALDFYVRPRDA